MFVKDVTEQDKLERMRRDFVGNVSHELRTPLTVMKGYIETLQTLMPASNATLHNSLRVMETQTERMERLRTDHMPTLRIENHAIKFNCFSKKRNAHSANAIMLKWFSDDTHSPSPQECEHYRGGIRRIHSCRP